MARQTLFERIKERTGLPYLKGFGQLIKVAPLFYKYGINLGTRNKEGFTLLTAAAIGQNSREVKALLAAGVDINARNIDGYTALDWSVFEECKDIVKILANANGINLKAKGPKGTTVMHIAALRENKDILEILMRAAEPEKFRKSNVHILLDILEMAQELTIRQETIKQNAETLSSISQDAKKITDIMSAIVVKTTPSVPCDNPSPKIRHLSAVPSKPVKEEPENSKKKKGKNI